MTHLDIIHEADGWMALDGVSSIAESVRDGKPCIVVTVTKNRDVIREQIPETFKGYKVYIETDDEVTIL